jgi:osmotically-inducible protein OsmY
MVVLDQREAKAKIGPLGIPPQPDPASQAESQLRSHSYLALKNISCEYCDGVLTLKGHLPTYYLKQMAQEVVAPTEGVERISNQIEVVAPGARLAWEN